MTTTVRLLVLLSLLASTACSAAWCRRDPPVPEATYREAVVAFYTGLAALQTSQEVLARSELDRVIALVPQEPAGWANLGLLLLRQQEIDPAVERLQKAAELAPESAHIQRLLALAAGRRGDLAAAVRHWKAALDIEPDDPKAAYALALDLERQGGPDNEAEAQRTLAGLADQDDDLVVVLELARLAAKREDVPALKEAIGTLEQFARQWPPDIRQRFDAVREAAGTDPPAAGQQIAFLKNVLLRLPEYRQALALVSTPREQVGEPLARFLVLPNPPPQAAPADVALAWTVQPSSDLVEGGQHWAGAVSLTGEGAPVLVAAGAGTLRIGTADGDPPVEIALPAHVAGAEAAGRHRLLAADLNYDYRTDVVIAGPGGLAIIQQAADGSFEDVTAAAALPADVPAWGAWAADVDTDGDLDLVVAREEGAPLALRNNGDGTFAAQEPFPGVSAARGFVWVDLDGEGVPDAAFLQQDGRLRVFLNERGGVFRERAVPDDVPGAVAIAADDRSGTVLDLVALTSGGDLVRLSIGEDGGWQQQEIGSADAPADLAAGTAGLVVADLDNNGASDFILAGPTTAAILLGGPDASVQALSAPVALDVRGAADLDGNGRLELVGLAAGGRVATASSQGERSYHWMALRPRAATVTGDQRINSFGIGGEVEVRTGLHVQRQPIGSPIVHVGLGDATSAEVARVFWPNGTIQSEFDLGSDSVIAATQRLKGSCPWLFAWDGEQVGFVTDVLWRSPLGLRINAQETANVLMTEDRVKVRGDQLAPRDGVYDLRITAELWETHFFDLVSLLAVDHPEGTEVWIDERFAVPPPDGELIVTGPVQPLAGARDDRGRDRSAEVAARDDWHLDFAGRGAYQGVTREHYVELELPEEAPRSGALWLIAQGWVHPTDSSVNVAISQGDHPRPHGIALQVAGTDGRFRTVAPDLGFPAGKDKTILIDLEGVFPRTGPRRLRLATNMEIFWDRLGWAEGRPDVTLRPVRLVPESAELRYRGYSVTGKKDPGTPERPRYVLAGTAPRWRDLEGYHTRFGDVRELLLQVDDRYVIMNAGDELRLRFPAVPPTTPGETRDFVFVSDGWEKDGDYNTTYSRTVLPLPTHDRAEYDRPPGRLEDDPVYVKHPQDFVKYHTRYVTPAAVRDALAPPERDVRP